MKVLVTGATGFIGAHTVKALVDAGHEVRATVRSEGSRERGEKALEALGAPNVELVIATLDDDAGWAEAVAGIEVVHHVASPVPVEQPKDKNEVIEPARDGALRVLRAAREAGVRRVVLTSSVAAIAGQPTLAKSHFGADDWTDLSVPGVSPYVESKTLSERAARDFVKEGGPELVTVCPGLVMGPLVGGRVNASNEFVSRFLNGAMPFIPRLSFSCVDVRDVAALHVLAMDAEDGARLVATNGQLWLEDIAATLRQRLDPAQTAKVPTRRAPNFVVRLLALFDGGVRTIVPMLGRSRTLDNGPSLALGWTPRDPRDSVEDTARSMLAAS
ncbi:MAG: NAD-dependent epimerase/dehydratase family protein [Myxococcota bacterium]